MFRTKQTPTTRSYCTADEGLIFRNVDSIVAPKGNNMVKHTSRLLFFLVVASPNFGEAVYFVAVRWQFAIYLSVFVTWR